MVEPSQQSSRLPGKSARLAIVVVIAIALLVVVVSVAALAGPHQSPAPEPRAPQSRQAVADTVGSGTQYVLGFGIGGAITVVGLIFFGAQVRRASAQQRRLAALVESANDAIIGMTLDGTVTDWNRAAERVFGFEGHAAIGRTVRELIVPPQYHAEHDAIIAQAGRGETLPHSRAKRRRRDGSIVEVSMTVSPVFRADGRVVGASKTVRDITAQVRAEHEASAAQARLKLTTELVGIAFWEWNPATNEVTWDDTMAALYGRRPEDFQPDYARWRAAVHPDDIAGAEAALARAIARAEPFLASFRILTPDGAIRHICSQGALTLDDSGRVIHMLGINFDVTKDRTREREVASLNATLEEQVLARTAELSTISTLQRAILTDAALGIIATDIDGTITLFNPAVERMLGYSAAEIVGRFTPALFHDRAEIIARAAVLTAEIGMPVEPGFDVFTIKARAGISDANEWTYLRKDGSRFPAMLNATGLFDADGNVFGYLGMIVDLTEQHRKDRALKDNRALLQAVTDNIPGMVAYWDAGLHCRFSNGAYLKWFGKTRDEMVGIHLSDLQSAEAFAVSQPYISAVFRGEPQRFERRIVRPDGSVGYTLTHYIPDNDRDVVSGFYVLASDITELKETDLRLEAVNRTLERRTIEAEAATAAKGQFLANMSHEIRSPMNAILGMLQLLRSTELTARQADYATKACSATQSLLQLLNDILDFSKIEAGKLEFEHAPFEIDSLMRDVSTLLSASLGSKPVELLFAIDHGLTGPLLGDAFRLRQVLLNLAGNAIKFTSTGEVIVGIRQVAHEAQRCVIEFSVQDTGIGIAPAALAAIFEGFNQAEASTTRTYGGTGLGLAISQRLVALMGGRVDVESEIGRGSRFHFTLAFERAPHETRIDPSLNARAGSTQLQRVLVVDDNEHARAALIDLVKSLAWSCDDVGSGADALAAIGRAANGEPYDVLLIDLNMPGLDGWQTARRLRALQPAPNASIILMVSAHGLQDVGARTNADPGIINGVLVKPVTASALITMVLEAHADRHTIAASADRSSRPRRLAGLKLLVVDDSALNQQVAGELLSMDGAEVEIAGSGSDAIAKVLGSQPPFDAILMDIQMPAMDGYETTRRIRTIAAMATVPIIAMTANVMESDKQACRAAGMDDHLPKPIEIDAVVHTILRHVRPAIAPPIVSAGAASTFTRAPRLIDVEAALQRLGNNRPLFANVAALFIAQTDDLIGGLRASIDNGAPGDALELLHQLKGSAGTVGNTDLSNVSSQLEAQLKTTGRLADPSRDLGRIEALLRSGNGELEGIIARF